MTTHNIGTSLERGMFRSTCSCGWRESSTTWDGMVRLKSAHLRSIPPGDVNPLTPQKK